MSSGISTAPQKRDLTKYLMLLAISLFWGLNWPAVKTILSQVPPLTLRAVGFTLGAVIILALTRLTGRSLTIPRRDWPSLVAAGVCNVLVFNLCTAFAQLGMATSRAAVIAFTMPVWATLLAIPVLKEWPRRQQIAGLACGMAGLAVLLGPDGLKQGLGPGLMLIAAVAWAVGTIVMKRHVWGGAVMAVTGWQYVISAFPMVILAALLEASPDPASFPPAVWLAISWHLLLSLCAAQVLWFVVVSRVSVGQAAVSTLLIPVVGVSGSVLLLGDALTPTLLIALGLILTGVACVLLPSSKR